MYTPHMIHNICWYSYIMLVHKYMYRILHLKIRFLLYYYYLHTLTTDLPLSNPATAKQQQQQVYPAHSLPHPHQHKVVGSGGGGGIPSQIPVMPPHVMTIGGRPVNSMATMLPIYKPSSSSSIAMQQLPPKVPALHGIGDGVGEIRPHIQASVGQKMLPLGHSVAVPVTTASPSQMNLGDITTTSMSLSDLAPRVESLGFPASSSFVIGTVERYVHTYMHV